MHTRTHACCMYKHIFHLYSLHIFMYVYIYTHTHVYVYKSILHVYTHARIHAVCTSIYFTCIATRMLNGRPSLSWFCMFFFRHKRFCRTSFFMGGPRYTRSQQCSCAWIYVVKCMCMLFLKPLLRVRSTCVFTLHLYKYTHAQNMYAFIWRIVCHLNVGAIGMCYKYKDLQPWLFLGRLDYYINISSLSTYTSLKGMEHLLLLNMQHGWRAFVAEHAYSW